MSKYPFTYEEVEVETNTEFLKRFKGHPSGLVRVQPGNFLLTSPFKEYGEKIYNMEIRPDDIWVLSWPKAGTTWTQELVWTVNNGGDVEKAKELDLWKKWHFVEFDCLLVDAMAPKLAKMSEEEKLKHSHFHQTDIAPSPRYIKSHLPLSMLPPKLLDTCKVIHVARNPLDSFVSFYHHSKNFYNHGFDGEFEDFFEININDKGLYSPYWTNILESWKVKDHKNMCFLFYEEMKQDLSAAIQKVAKFLGKTLTPEQEEKMLDHLSFKSMKNNPKVNMEAMKDLGALRKDANFIRKGIVGDWKNYLTPEMVKKVQEWNKKYIAESDISFPGFDILGD